jgi:hypothetical protein
MLRIRAPYADRSKKIVGPPQLRWPAVCACCGYPQPQTAYLLDHLARRAGGIWSVLAFGAFCYTPETGYRMQWNVPCCGPCLVHAHKSHNPLSLKAMVICGGIPTAFIGSFILWSMGVANGPDLFSDPVGDVIAVCYILFSFLVWVGIWQLFDALMRWRGSRFVTPVCADPRAPVIASSNTQFVRFDFTNDRYAWGVAQSNGLMVEPARFTTVPFLADLGAPRLG